VSFLNYQDIYIYKQNLIMKNFDLKTITEGEYKLFPTTINGQKGYVLKRRVNFLLWKRWVPVINRYGVIQSLECDKEYLEMIINQLEVCLTVVDVFELKTLMTINKDK